jgi:hypothetical protein
MFFYITLLSLLICFVATNLALVFLYAPFCYNPVATCSVGFFCEQHVVHSIQLEFKYKYHIRA